MKPENDATADRLIEIFNQAKLLPAGEQRAQFLDEACGEDQQLHAEVDSLLQAGGSAGDYLRPDPAVSPQMQAEFARLKPEEAGDWIAHYKLLEQIGEGGFGTVWVAEQSRPVRRRVALKIIKLGMDTKEVIARFEQERQALAMMDHPNIAKVFDAGTTEAGRPYFVMELVNGIKITEYADQANLATAERLQLFMAVCNAVQHAHLKGIIHRDLKPSNILVTLHDGVPVPKVIDFGVAKATQQQRLSDLTVYTQFAQMIGTPAYMSPEQAEMSGLDIDTRSDIYSLGIILYELLTGRTPFDPETLMREGLDALRRRIREEEPPKPSTFISTMAAPIQTSVARHRHVEPSKLIGLIRGDLDWIVMKAIEKDRTRRYDTANGLAADLQRHLDNEPVLARPPSRAYQFQKMVRRNKLAVAAAGAVTCALIIGLGFSMWLYFRERIAVGRAEANATRANTEAAKATAISDFLQQLLGSANPDEVKGADYTVRQLLDHFSSGLANQLDGQPEVEAALRATLGRTYRRLGVTDQAQVHLKRALTLRRSIFGEQSEPVAEILVESAWVFHEQRRQEKGQRYAREAMVIYRRLGTTGQPVLYALWTLEANLSALSRFAEVEAVAEEAMTIAAKSPGVEFPELASIIHGLAGTKNQQSQFAEGESLARKALEMHRRLRGPDHPETGWALVNLATALKGQKKFAEAEPAFREILRIFSKYYAPGYKTVDWATQELKSVLKSLGDSPAVSALAAEGIAIANKRIERNEDDVEAWMERANGRADLASWNEALADCTEALKRIQNALPTDTVVVGARFHAFSQLAYASAPPETAEQVARQVLAALKLLVRADPENSENPKLLGHAKWQLGHELRKAKRFGEAEQVILESLRFFTDLTGDFPAHSHLRLEHAYSHKHLAEVVDALGRIDDANEHYRVAIDGYAELAADAPQTVYFEEIAKTIELARKLQVADRSDWARAAYLRAITRLEESIAMRRKLADGDDLDNAAALKGISFLHRQLGNLHEAQGKTEKATVAYKQALALDPQSARACNDLAWLLATCSDAKFREPKQAVDMAMKAVELDPTKPGYFNTLGAAHYRRGDWQSALAALEKSKELRKGGDSTGWFFVAMAHWQLGNKDEARQWHTTAVEWMEKNAPTNGELIRFRDEAAELLGVNANR